MESREQQPASTPMHGSASSERVAVLTRLSDGREFALSVGSVRVGRTKAANLILSSRTVSRHHADVTYESGRYVLYDNSSNGTWINGVLVAVAQALREGDTVKFGDVEFRFTWKTGEAARRAWEQMEPGLASRAGTERMKGAKPKLRKLRRRRRGWLFRGPILVLILVVVGGAVLYFVFPELAERLITALRGLFGGA